VRGFKLPFTTTHHDAAHWRKNGRRTARRHPFICDGELRSPTRGARLDRPRGMLTPPGARAAVFFAAPIRLPDNSPVIPGHREAVDPESRATRDVRRCSGFRGADLTARESRRRQVRQQSHSLQCNWCGHANLVIAGLKPAIHLAKKGGCAGQARA
jgi:hypothetical protein